ncbi:MAG: DNA methyltransferase [Chloroflexi bacterium]|nr:DNA methyltransferase [Chloroflexota bacterium]
MQNSLYYGDNLTVLREHIPDESVDLIYLDPPFNSNASYNVLFKEKTGEESAAQFKAFTDTWKWTKDTQWAFEKDIIANPAVPVAVRDMVDAFKKFIGQNDMMAYLVMMAPRLVELRRVLKQTGSLYLHCDPTASHYLKILMDAVFGKDQFRNEIVWRRTGSHNQNKRFGPIHDVILFYTKSDNYLFDVQFQPVAKGHVDGYFRQEDDKGKYWTNALTGAGTRNGESGQPWRGYDPTPHDRHWAVPGNLVAELGIDATISQHEKLEQLYQAGYVDLPTKASDALPTFRQYLKDLPGSPLQDLWAYQPYTRGVLYGDERAIDEDVRWIPRQGGKERLGYQTQKPQALLERVIKASTSQGQMVLDPFCGCGTAIAAAQALGRQWIGIDITHLAVALMKNRLRTAFNLEAGKDYTVIGEPVDVGSAQALAEQDRFQFQFWALSLLEAFPREEGKKGPDGGIDGVLSFIDGKQRTQNKAIVQVKSGHVSAPQIRDLKGVVEREKASLGLFITLEEPTSVMQTEAIAAGFFHSELWQKDYPKIQIRTVQQLLTGQGFELPPQLPSMYQPAQRVRRKQGRQASFGESS